ncbi:putative Zn-dependent protease [Rippkaea orientalis PCC 8801]|uniref:Putative Zn-dependent protease n=1 Tax=Rippkaea orientalis (strain PCC 8801 / RF-1) TaxID=41431 RepID=B7K601_RIPO1|nr:TldD/PmbA family protein [Rippkaea orientalis]ACK68054.1 putative Zn-dependent protease [Rippkaea orientalis PCC 8801]
MNLDRLEQLEVTFNQLSEFLIDQLNNAEHLSLELSSEQTQFIRFNNAKVRQTGLVTDGNIKLSFIANQRTVFMMFPFTGDLTTDQQNGLESLNYLRQDILQVPEDPHLVLPENKGTTREVYRGDLLVPEIAVKTLLPEVQNLDMTGIYTAGQVIRGNANSEGQNHWFATDSFCLDYSLIAPSEKAVKGILSGRNWDEQQYQTQIKSSQNQLLALNKSPKQIQPGGYRTYFAPAATADLLGMLSWGAISEASLRQGGSALMKLKEGKTLSPKLNLQENFSLGSVPKFNELGEISPDILPLITEGNLINTLVNSRTATEYKITANGANSSESLRSPELGKGTLSSEDIFNTLGTGLYLSNLHYLNWSDRTGGRITGMTRYACFWVENGEIVAPIKDLRFDDSLYRFWGENLEALTDFQEFIPETNTYERREIGGSLVPGMLVNDFQFTL